MLVPNLLPGLQRIFLCVYFFDLYIWTFECIYLVCVFMVLLLVNIFVFLLWFLYQRSCRMNFVTPLERSMATTFVYTAVILLTCHTRWNVSCIYFTYPSGQDLVESI